MCEDARLSFRTFLLFFYVSTHIGLVKIPITFSILSIVIVRTMLVIMIFSDIAWVHFEDFKI